MKKNWLLLVLTLFSLSMGLSSCSDDDDNQKVVESIYGTYLGEILEVELNGSPLLDGKSIPEKIHLTQGANGKAHFELKDFSFEGIALGD
ncbi:MAG: calycin-like domain-containing protein, partial [Bacteroides sp.]|nr:calycin-like domain-containing protein [Bacteroides sp.]